MEIMLAERRIAVGEGTRVGGNLFVFAWAGWDDASPSRLSLPDSLKVGGNILLPRTHSVDGEFRIPEHSGTRSSFRQTGSPSRPHCRTARTAA